MTEAIRPSASEIFAGMSRASAAAYGGGAAAPGGPGRPPDAGGPGLRERLGHSSIEFARGSGRFATGLIDSTLKNPTFWYSTLTAATIAGIRTAAVHAGAAEMGEVGVVIAGAIAGGLKDGITEAFFRSKNKKKAVGAILS